MVDNSMEISFVVVTMVKTDFHYMRTDVDIVLDYQKKKKNFLPLPFCLKLFPLKLLYVPEPL